MPVPSKLPVGSTPLECSAGDSENGCPLVCGLAHDFNNLLTAIGGHAALIEAEAAPGSDLEASATTILKAVEHAAAIAERLRNVTQPEQNHISRVDLNMTVAEVSALLRMITSPNIEMRHELHAPAAVVLGNPAQIHTLVLNLVLNAREAMPNGGLLTVETGQEGSDAILSVTDNGCGIDPAIRERIFKPFFTTRIDRGGSGMGLAVVTDIVDRHGGTIQLESELGVGSTFRVRLPLAAAKAASTSS